MKEIQWPMALAYTATLLVLGALVYTGKTHAEALLAAVAWLIPSPLKAPK